MKAERPEEVFEWPADVQGAIVQKRQQDAVNNIETANSDGFEQIDPPIRVLDYFEQSE